MMLFCLFAVLLVGTGRGEEPTNLPDNGEGYYTIVRLSLH